MGLLHINPAEMMHSFTGTNTQVPALVNRRERRFLSLDEARRLLRELAEPYSTMVLLALLSGLRRSEILGLKWRYVDFTERLVTVAETCYEGRIAAPKTRASKRKVFLDEAVMEALRRLQPDFSQPDSLVFPLESGGPLNPSNVQGPVLSPACARAGIPHVSWHAFRYTYSTWAESAGESTKALQAQLGHTNPKITLDVYTQPMPEAQREIASKVAGVLLPLAPNFEDVSEVPGRRIQ